jgi:Lar family restriction alleviation protein
MSNAPGGVVRVGSIVVEAKPGGMCIGTVHGNHQPNEVARADILDLHEAIGRFIEQARGEPGYDEHLVARDDPGDILPCPFCGRAVLEIVIDPRAGHPAVTCAECGAGGPPSRSPAKREAAANWNRRVRPRDGSGGQ